MRGRGGVTQQEEEPMLTQEQAEKILTEGCRSVRRIDEEWITNTVVMLRMPWVGTLPKMQVEAKDLDRLLHAPTEPCVERVDLRRERETKLVACGCMDGRCACDCGHEHACGDCHGTKLREKVVTFGRPALRTGAGARAGAGAGQKGLRGAGRRRPAGGRGDVAEGHRPAVEPIPPPDGGLSGEGLHGPARRHHG